MHKKNIPTLFLIALFFSVASQQLLFAADRDQKKGFQIVLEKHKTEPLEQIRILNPQQEEIGKINFHRDDAWIDQVTLNQIEGADHICSKLVHSTLKQLKKYGKDNAYIFFYSEGEKKIYEHLGGTDINRTWNDNDNNQLGIIKFDIHQLVPETTTSTSS